MEEVRLTQLLGEALAAKPGLAGTEDKVTEACSFVAAEAVDRPASPAGCLVPGQVHCASA